MSTARPISERPVLVLGAGPAGLVAAITLARYGCRVVLVDKRLQHSTLSRALAISTRSMELFRSWGLEESVRAGAADVEPAGWVTPTLLSGEGTSFPLGYPTAAEAARVSPSRPSWTPQNHTEPLLFSQLEGRRSVTTRLGLELVHLEMNAVGARARLRDTTTGHVSELEASFVIGADGAHSAVRSQLGIEMDGCDDLGEFHAVQFDAALWAMLGNRRYGLNITTNPEAAGALAPLGGGDRWAFTREWRPGEPRLVDMPSTELVPLLAAAIGTSDVPIRIERTSSFSFAAQIAQRYRAGRAFLIGDAAHRMTPRGGTGMNTAIQDGFDIGWKLAWVLRGWATPSLLDTYETERRPIGLHNVQRSERRDGATQSSDEALPWDLNGRLGHHWIGHGTSMRSTLDLVGDGLTVIASSREPRWNAAFATINMPVPINVHSVDEDTAVALGIPERGAVLVRPDHQPLQRWSSFSAVASPDFRIAAAPSTRDRPHQASGDRMAVDARNCV